MPLGEYVKGRFYRGILTGFNEAFVIDESTRRQLIQEDPKSAELIKPWLRGRDIKKWRAEWAKLFVIFTRHGTNIQKYPAVKRHLAQFRVNLTPKTSADQKYGRKPGHYAWYEIQDSTAYYPEFERSKIVYPDIGKLCRACWDDSGSYLGNTTYFIPTEDKFLLAILTSSLFDYYCRQNLQCLGDPFNGGRMRFIAQYMEQVPIVIPTASQKNSIIQRVNAILKNPSNSKVPLLEAELNELILDLYGLTETERRLIHHHQEKLSCLVTEESD